MSRIGFSLLLHALMVAPALHANWPTLRGNPQRTGHIDAPLPRVLKLAWAVEFDRERLGTAMEPIVKGTHAFVATHAGRLWALDTATGSPAWRIEVGSPILHSPAATEDLVVAATADGRVFAVDTRHGGLAWVHDGDPAGYAASPLILGDQVLLGSRGGSFSALDLASGETVWERHLPAPIRQTAAGADDHVWVTAEDLVTRCLSRRSGRALWESKPASGQSARDYYPVLTERHGRRFVVTRTSPAIDMARRIGLDRAVLIRNAGIGDSDWRKVEAWTTNAASTATPELAQREQDALGRHLDRNPDARSFFLYDAASGRPHDPVPILWAGGCQGVPAPPVAFPDGRLLTRLRSAYGHWSLGVAPLVGLGYLDPATLDVELLNQTSGARPPWNTFWGTADEEQNMVVFRDAAVVIHQGTLSRLDLSLGQGQGPGQLTPILGERDTFGGFRPPAWARNEWHGPARGGVAWSNNRLFWLVGSRLLCLAPHGAGSLRVPRTLTTADAPIASRLPPAPTPTRADLSRLLARRIRELLDEPWAPLALEPGLGGRAVFFDHPADPAESLALAWPHLSAELRQRVAHWLPNPVLPGDPSLNPTHPDSPARTPTPARTRPREYHPAPGSPRPRLSTDRAPTAFARISAITTWYRRSDPEALDDLWPGFEDLWLDFQDSGWHLNPARGDLHANRILASLLAFADLAREQDEPGIQAAARAAATQTTDALIAWWKRSATDIRLDAFQGSRDVDAFIGAGDSLFHRVAPHRHRLALFQDLTPEVARLIRDRAPDAVDTVWHAFEQLCPTWWLVGEERQVHSGENAFDTPDFTTGAFRAFAFLRHTPPAALAARIDIPSCRADLFHIARIAIALDAATR